MCLFYLLVLNRLYFKVLLLIGIECKLVVFKVFWYVSDLVCGVDSLFEFV